MWEICFQCANIVYKDLKRMRPFRNKSVFKVGCRIQIINIFILPLRLQVKVCFVVFLHEKMHFYE